MFLTITGEVFTAGCVAYSNRRGVYCMMCCLQLEERCLLHGALLTITGKVLTVGCAAYNNRKGVDCRVCCLQ